MRTMRRLGRVAPIVLMGASLLFAGEGGRPGEGTKPGEAPKAAPSAKKCPYSTQDCLNHMAARLKASGWIGIEYDTDESTGVATVKKIFPGSPAEKGGLEAGDVLFALNGVPIRNDNEKELAEARKEWKPGQTVHYTIKRNGQTKAIDIVLAPWPADVLAHYIGEHMLEHAEADAAAAPPAPAPK